MEAGQNGPCPLVFGFAAAPQVACPIRRLIRNCAVTGRVRSREICEKPLDQAPRTFDHFTNNLASGPNVVNESHGLSN